jgi:hypothetical protein
MISLPSISKLKAASNYRTLFYVMSAAFLVQVAMYEARLELVENNYRAILGWDRPGTPPPWDGAKAARPWPGPTRPMYEVENGTYIPKQSQSFQCLGNSQLGVQVLNHNGLDVKVRDLGDSWAFRIQGRPNESALVGVTCLPWELPSASPKP